MIEELQKVPKVTEVFPLSAPLCPIFIDSFAKLLLPIKMQSAPLSDCNQLSDTDTGVNEFCSLKQRPGEGEVEEEPLEGAQVMRAQATCPSHDAGAVLRLTQPPPGKPGCGPSHCLSHILITI